MHGLLLALLIAADSAGAQREQGKALFKEGRLDDAIAHFESAVALNPSDAEAWYNLAYASRKAQKFARAAEAYALLDDRARFLVERRRVVHEVAALEGAEAGVEVIEARIAQPQPLYLHVNGLLQM